MEHSEVDWRECEVDNEESIKIKVENESTINTDTEEFGGTKTFEELYIKNEHLEGTDVSNSIKSEPDEVDWDQYDTDNKRILEMEAENNKLDMELYSQVKEELIFKDESDKNTDTVSGIVLSSMDNSNECATCENEDLNIQLSQMKPETDMDTQTRVDPVPDAASNSMPKSKSPKKQQVVDKKTGRKSYSCYNCNHTVYTKPNLIKHVKLHDNQKRVYSKTALDDHISEKHYESVVSSEIHASKQSTCIHCDAANKDEITLHDHAVRKHPNFITSVTRKLHECTKCAYKTVQKSYLDKHMLKHPETTPSYKLSTCIHCKVTFRTKRALDNHVVRKHPNSREVYECTECTYKTNIKYHFVRHMSVHTRELDAMLYTKGKHR